MNLGEIAAGLLIVSLASSTVGADETGISDPWAAPSALASHDDEEPPPLHERVFLAAQARISQRRYLFDQFREVASALEDPALSALAERCAAQLNQQDYDGALATSQEMVRAFPTSWFSHYVSAVSAMYKGDGEGALRAIDAADQLKPSALHSMELRVILYWAKGDLERARASARTLLAQYPNLPDGLMLDGLISYAADEPQEALRAFQRLLEVAPQHCLARTTLIRLDRTLGRRREALAAIEAIPATCSADEGALLKTDILLEMGRIDDAKVAYRAFADQEQPTPEELIVGLRIAYATWDYDRAVAISKRLVQMLPDEPVGYIVLCEAYVAKKEFGLAHEMAQLIERLFPAKSFVFANWGFVHEQEERYPEALEAFHHALERDPGNPAISFHIASLYLEQSRYDEALEVLRTGLAASPNDYGLHKLSGKVAREMKHYPEAIRAYRAAIALQPQRSGAHVGLGTAYLDSGQFESAKTAYQEAVQWDPSNFESHWGLGLAYLWTGAYERAIDEAKTAMALDPESGMPYEVAAQAYFRTGRRAEATATCEQLAAQPFFNAGKYSELGWCYRKIEQDDKAIEAFQHAVARNPRWVHAIVQLAALQNTTGHYEQARATIQQGLQVAPNERRLLMELVVAHLGLGDRAQARTIAEQIVAMDEGAAATLATDALDLGLIFSKAARAVASDEDQLALLQQAKSYYAQSLARDPHSSKAAVGLASLYTSFSRYAEFHDDQRALELYQDALRQDANNPYAYRNLAYLHYRQGQQDEARQNLERVLALDPAFPGAHLLLASVYKSMGDRQKALEMCQQALALRPDDASIYVVMGHTYTELRKASEAQRAFEEALRLDPQQAQAYGGLTTLYNKLGDQAKAIEVGTQAIALNPRLANAHDALGQAYGATGQLDKALECFRRAIAIDPAHAMYYNNIGFVYLMRRDHQAAIPYLEQAVQGHAGGIAYHNLGSAYQAVGKYEQAKKAYQQAVGSYRSEGQTRKAAAVEQLLGQVP